MTILLFFHSKFLYFFKAKTVGEIPTALHFINFKGLQRRTYKHLNCMHLAKNKMKTSGHHYIVIGLNILLLLTLGMPVYLHFGAVWLGTWPRQHSQAASSSSSDSWESCLRQAGIPVCKANKPFVLAGFVRLLFPILKGPCLYI